jgi:hypothetical protein
MHASTNTGRSAHWPTTPCPTGRTIHGMVVTEPRRVLVLLPITPRPTGDGLSMRAWRLVHAFEADELVVAVEPVISGVREVWWKRPGASLQEAHRENLSFVPFDEFRDGYVALCGDQRWRSWLDEIEPLPELADHAHPAMALGLARAVQSFVTRARAQEGGHTTAAVAGWEPEAVFVFRSYMAALGLALAEGFGCKRVVLDLDDDEVGFFQRNGAVDLAEGYDRILRTVGRHFTRVTLSSTEEAHAVEARWGLRAAVLPNSVEVPERVLEYDEHGRTVLMVANFGYEPNVEGAEWLRARVWPVLEQLVSAPCSLRLAGKGLDEFDDLRPVYGPAGVVAVPLLKGAGTRIKVLEAWALGRPVVATSVGVAGLGATDGQDALIRDDPCSFAGALRDVLEDPELARGLVLGGRRRVEAFSAELVEEQLRSMVSETVPGQVREPQRAVAGERPGWTSSS